MLSIVFFQMRLYFKNKYRRMAIYDLLLRIESPNLENYHKVNYANLILKKVAIQVYGREKVAKMFGEQWLQYLDSKCEKSELSELKIVFENSSYNLKQISDSEFDLVLERTKYNSNGNGAKNKTQTCMISKLSGMLMYPFFCSLQY